MRENRFLIILFLILFGPLGSTAQQLVLEEHFTDKDLTTAPVWSGDTDNYSFYDDTGNIRLQLDAPEAGTSYLSTSSKTAYGSWRLFLRFDSFSLSGSNNLEVFLTSDTPTLSGDVTGYALVAGESGSDDVFKIVRYDDGDPSPAFVNGTTVINSGGDYQVQIERSPNGKWTLAVGGGYNSEPALEASGVDNTNTSSSYFGFRPEYTSTRTDRFYFDDIKIAQSGMALVSVEVLNSRELKVFFTNDLDPATVDNADFNIDNGIGRPDGVAVQDNSVTISYNDPVPGNDYTLNVSNLDDQSGITVDSNSTYTFTLFDSFDNGDIVINEFMYDEPEGLTEYVEIRNITSKRFNLSSWELGDANETISLRSDTLILEANDFLVISPDTAALFNRFGSRNYVSAARLPALNNSGDIIRFYTAEGTTADSLSYSPTWGGAKVALERRSATTTAKYRENWGDSPNTGGGTPGLTNEVAVDKVSPYLTGYKFTNSQTLTLFFNERLLSESAGYVSHYILEDNEISSAQFREPDTVQLSLAKPLANNTHYNLEIAGVEDIFSNKLSSKQVAFTYYEISKADSGDVFINEFMFDPPNGATEYVELYNPTQQSFNLQDWTLNDNRGNRLPITQSRMILPPVSYMVIAPDSSLITMFPEIPLVAMGNNFPSLNNSGDDIVIRNSMGTLLDSLSYNSSWGDGNRSLERRAKTISGIYRENWGNSPDKNGATPGLPNKIPADTAAPTLTSLDILNNRSLSLVFDERIDSVSAGKTSNYSLSGKLDVNSAVIAEPDTVYLSLNNPFQNAVSYKLAFSGVKDIFDNSTGTLETAFTYYEISPADSGDVFVNEFLFNPPAGSTEFIELYNPTEKSIDLRNWSINDNTGNRRILAEDRFVLPPDSFVVIAPDSTLFESHPDMNFLAIGNRFPSLNNSGDDIVLRNRRGVLIDSLRYHSSWGGNEVSLERRTTSIAGYYRENWGEAESEIMSPGNANSAGPDTDPPEMVRLEYINTSTIQLTFSETIDKQHAVESSNYSISPSRNIQLVSAEHDTITLDLAEDLNSGTTYDVTVANLTDLFGNALQPVTLTRKYLRFAATQPGDVVINEILYKRRKATDPEFVELYNRSPNNFDLTDWSLGDGSDEVEIPSGTHLESGDCLILTDNKNLASELANGHYLADFPTLNDDEDAVYIRSGQQLTIDSLYYHSSWGGSDGTSIERKDPGGASNDASNWVTNRSTGGTSPGVKNGGFNPDKDPPVAIFSTPRPGNRFEVRFNEFIQLTPDLTFLLDGTELKVVNFEPENGNQIQVRYPALKGKNAKGRTITIRNLSDVKGNTTSSASIPVTERLEPGAVVINEIMYNPLNNPDDNKPDQGEYIELRNRMDYAISLEGFTLHDAPDERGEVRTHIPVSTTSMYLPPHGHLLVYADKTAGFTNSKTATFFKLDEKSIQNNVRIDNSTLGLASTDDAIYLADSTGTTIDSVYYDKSWHNPNILDPRGVSLERINPSGPSSEAINWSSSTINAGGTPGAENSIFQVPEKQSPDIGITFNPNPFSPDSDGYEDNLFINYKLDQPDYLLNVRIFDRYGRLVRKLVDGKPAGYEGTLQWDGQTGAGNRNRIGIYIVLFEAYNSTNGSDRTFKEVVVLARKM